LTLEPQAPGNAAPIVTDAVIVGAGPAGLFAAFELGLLEVRAHLVDALPDPGGQCVELYPDKPIFDLPGIPRCSGRELAERLLEQLRPIGTPIHLGQQVQTLTRRADGRFDLATSAGLRLDTRVVIVAGGAGAFQPRKLNLDGIERHEPAQVAYRLKDASDYADARVLVFGDDEVAIGAALRLSDRSLPTPPARVTLVHRRDAFRAPGPMLAQWAAARAAGQVDFVAAQPVGLDERDGRLAALNLVDADGATLTLPADRLLVLLGLSPKLGPIADWGLAMHKRQLVVDPARFATSEPGVFAIGDVVTYPGKRKLILCGFHEATLAAFAAAAIVRPESQGPLEYTTTSSRLRRILGVDAAGNAVAAAPPAPQG
jgi:thioredoxin reductase (NADPH)